MIYSLFLIQESSDFQCTPKSCEGEQVTPVASSSSAKVTLQHIDVVGSVLFLSATQNVPGITPSRAADTPYGNKLSAQYKVY